MSASPRVFSEYGYLHVYTRGNGKQAIFENRGDYIYYLQLLKRFSSETNVKICAFCLMENHTHLIIYDPEHNMPQFMKQLDLAYTVYFNRKYGRSGHLFDGRYKSLPIESEEYLLTVFRYVLNNPRQANICSAADYPWNSYSRYGASDSFVDTSVFCEMIGDREKYEAFIAAKYEDCPELENIVHDDEWGRSVIRECLHLESGALIQSYDWKTRNAALRLLKEKGLSIRQIERLTGINRSTIQRA